MTADTLIWLGIALCITQSAMFSGLNLAFFGLSRLQLEVIAETDARAQRVLSMRQDSNFLLATILWGNVGINVLLTLLSNSVLAGVSAFLFSTILITFLGEIIPQAYFSRNALRMASLLGPLLRAYQFLLFPFAKPSALVLDKWLGKEAPEYFQEQVIKDMLRKHVEEEHSDVDNIEGIGAMNFLELDDIAAVEEGEPLDALSVVAMPTDLDLPRFPELVNGDMDNEFLRRINASGHKWVVLTDEDGEPQLILDADGFLRAVAFASVVDPYDFCHRPVIVRSRTTRLDRVIRMLTKSPTADPLRKGVIENDVVLVWTTDNKRIITGADLFGRLLDGVY